MGTEWSARWIDTRGGSARIERSYRYRIARVNRGRARIAIRGEDVFPSATWTAQGYVDVDLADGLEGQGVLRIRGPGAPRVNAFERHISVRR